MKGRKWTQHLLWVVLSVAPLAQPGLFCGYFLFGSNTWFEAEHPPFQQVSEPQALWGDVSFQPFCFDIFEEYVIPIVWKWMPVFSSKANCMFMILGNVIGMQDKASPIPQAAHNSFDWRISFLITELKWKVRMVGKNSGERLLISLPESGHTIKAKMRFSTQHGKLRDDRFRLLLPLLFLPSFCFFD